MANPFPGMDPYLEGDIWQSVHANLATEIARFLAPRLRPKYAVLTTERVVLSEIDDPGNRQIRFLDVGVLSERPRSASAAAVANPPLVAKALDMESTVQFSVEIRDLANRRLVTAIEILSHTNKEGSGRVEYAGKRRELLASDAHLVEIDLLRAGRRFPLDRPLPPAPYFVFVSRVEQRFNVDVWPMPLRDPLTPAPIPLDAGDADAIVDLQGLLNRLHEEFGYDLSVDYTKPPPGPLSADDLAWVDETLRAAARRT